MSMIPYRQLAPGTYDVTKGTGGNRVQTGYVYVEDGGNNVIVEHWVLLNAFENPTTSQAMAVTKASGSGYASLSAFLADMQQHQTSGALQNYVRADCFYYESLPS